MAFLSYQARGAATAERNRQRARVSGCNPGGYPLWRDWEDDVCRKHHPDYQTIKKVLKTRSLRAVRTHCQKLGLAIRRHIWTGVEISRLRRLYPAAEWDVLSSEFPFATKLMISEVSRRHGIYRNKKPYKRTGIAPLDQLRDKCFDIRWNMADLDKASGTKTYFQKMAWIGNKRPSDRAIGRAIRALDGEIEINWKY